MNTIKFAKKLAIPLFVALAYGPSQGLAASILGDELDNYAVLAAAGVTCVAPCTIFGDVGSFPTATGGAFTFLSGTVDDANAGTAQTELVAARTAGSTATPAYAITTFDGNLVDLQTAQGGTIKPGNYVTSAIGTLTGDITLAGGTDTNPVWKFLFASSLVTSTGSDVSVTGSFLYNAGIYWTVTAGPATLNGTSFAGNVMAYSGVTSDGTEMKIGCGRLLTTTASITLANDTVRTDCVGAGSGSDGFDQGNMAPVPEPETYAMMLAGLGLMGFVARRRQRNLAAAA